MRIKPLQLVLFFVFNAVFGVVGLTASATTLEAGMAGLHIDKVVVDKSDRRLYLIQAGEVVRDYRIALGRVPRGHKQFLGDGKTPEGRYFLGRRNDQSRFHRAIEISYPNEQDRANAQALGRPAGGEIMIHGLPEELLDWGSDHAMFNWTEGCIAVLNEEMDEIWRAVGYGTPIEIRP